jgi:serine/threonine protein kinase/Tol biopolymer transport system component
MDLQPGDKVGRYEIVSFVGAGGMGQVYRARDAQLARDVAVKLLPAVTGNAQSVARFHQEARALGLLNHPNLVTVYDFGTHGESFYIVLEFLEGETLRERLRGGALSQRKAIQYATQIARGMAAAHDRGIIHRDLKPENIFLLREGGLKILDFGLAKMNLAPDMFALDDESPTLIGTNSPGMVMGTVGYIAPEQLRGEEIDARADIFAFGGILHEMLTGRRAFLGSTAVETLSAVLRDEPAGLRELGIAPALEMVVHRCLEKRPQDRFQSARDLAFALEALGTSSDSLTLPLLTMFRKRTRRFRRIAAIAAILVAVASGGALLWSRIEPDDPPAYRQLTFRRGDISAARFTPDGGIAYSAAWEGGPHALYSARLDSVEARDLGVATRELLGVSRGGELALLVKPNDVSGTVALASLAGGAPREVATDVVAADFSPDGTKLAAARRLVDGRYQIEYPPGRIIYRCATRIRDLRVSPDGHMIAFRLREARLGKSYALFVVDDAGASPRKLGDWTNAKGLAWSPGGRIVFASSNSGSTEIRSATPGGKVRLVGRLDGSVKLHDVSRDGDLLLSRDDYREGIMARAPGSDRERDLSWFDGSGASDISPDGRLLLMSEFGEAGGSRYSAYVRPMNGDPAVRLGDGYGVSLSPDNSAALVIVPGTPARLAIVPLGAGETRLLERGGIEDYEFASWLPDGRTIVFNGRTATSPMRLYRQDVRRGAPAPIGPPDVRLAQPSRAASRDGRRLALLGDDESIVVMPSDGRGPAKKLAVSGGPFRPVAWSDDGRDLFVYRESELPAKLYRVNADSGAMVFVRELMPADAAGVYRVMDVVITPDDRAYAYGVLRNLSTLFLSTGWRKRIE